MFRTTLLGLALAALSFPAKADEASLTVVVVGPDAKPAIGAKVWVYMITGRPEDVKEPALLTTNAAGKVSVPATAAPDQVQNVFVLDGAGRFGTATIRSSPFATTDESCIKIVLIDSARYSGQILATDGKPIAAAKVVPMGYYRNENIGGIDLPIWIQTQLATTTAADGRFTIPTATADYSILYRVKAAGYGETRWLAAPKGDWTTKLSLPGTVTISFTGLDPTLLNGRGWRLVPFDNSREPALAPRPIKWRDGKLDGSGKMTIPEVPPGRYTLWVDLNGTVPRAREKPAPIDVAPAKTVAHEVKFGPAAGVTGKIIEKATGKGVAGVSVAISVSDNGSYPPKKQFFVTTDKEGRYSAYESAGWYSVWPLQLPDGFTPPPVNGPRRELISPARVEIGKVHSFPAIELPRAASLTGRVVLADGKPAAGATVLDHFQFGFPTNRATKVTADKHGNFTLKNLPVDDAVAPRVQLGNAVNVPRTIDLVKTTDPVTIEISEANAATFTGKVVDASGKPIRGLQVTLRQQIQLVGRSSPFGLMFQMGAATTGADGGYAFTGLWPRDNYSVQVSADGYSAAETRYLAGARGETQEFPTLKITRANASARGLVLGSDRKPIAGAEVFGVDGPTRVATTSAADGSFTLYGFYEGAGFIFAKKPGYRLAAVPVVAGSNDRVEISMLAANRPPSPPIISRAHRAALDKLTRHVLELLWESNGEFGYGRTALASMASFDLDTAKKWRDEAKLRSNGASDFTPTLDRAILTKTLLNLAKDDIDEALAVIGQLGAEHGFKEAIRLGEQMLAVDKVKAARLAEEAVVRARQRELPAKVWALAEAGDLAARAGNLTGGKKILAEAAELAFKLEPDARSMNTYEVGSVAARLAPYDWAKAESLLNRLTENSEYNQFLSAATSRLATTDLTKAKQLFDRFRPDNTFFRHEARLRAAFAIARERPDEAIELVTGVPEKQYRCLGYLRLATLFSATDKPRAIKMIDSVYDLLDREPGAFRGWLNFGGRAGLAAVAAVRAKEIGYPDLADLVGRTLAMRPSGMEDHWSPGERERNNIRIAAALALVDPASARQVLATVAPPDEFVQRALSQSRDWLFALALADPERALPLTDKLMAKAKTQRGGQNALSQTGLVELCTILTSDNALKELCMYANLPREIRDED